MTPERGEGYTLSESAERKNRFELESKKREGVVQGDGLQAEKKTFSKKKHLVVTNRHRGKPVEPDSSPGLV